MSLEGRTGAGAGLEKDGGGMTLLSWEAFVSPVSRVVGSAAAPLVLSPDASCSALGGGSVGGCTLRIETRKVRHEEGGCL